MLAVVRVVGGKDFYQLLSTWLFSALRALGRLSVTSVTASTLLDQDRLVTHGLL